MVCWCQDNYKFELLVIVLFLHFIRDLELLFINQQPDLPKKLVVLSKVNCIQVFEIKCKPEAYQCL